MEPLNINPAYQTLLGRNVLDEVPLCQEDEHTCVGMWLNIEGSILHSLSLILKEENQKQVVT